MLVQVYGKKAVSRKCVYDWFKRFRDGKETTEDEARSGRPSADPNVAHTNTIAFSKFKQEMQQPKYRGDGINS
jgi:hypothetical protein